ncbi:MAG: hypothetical protein WBB28_02160 [Crinalium sp.]
MTLNIELLEKVKARIMAEPLDFDIFASIEQGCGTVACIAGHAVILHAGSEQKAWDLCEVEGEFNWGFVEDTAMVALGLNSTEADKLFILHNWDEPYCSQYARRRGTVDELIHRYYNPDSTVSEVQSFVVKQAIAGVNPQCRKPLDQDTIDVIIKLKREMAEVVCKRINHFIATRK